MAIGWFNKWSKLGVIAMACRNDNSNWGPTTKPIKKVTNEKSNFFARYPNIPKNSINQTPIIPPPWR